MATYKLVKLHMKNQRHTNCLYGGYFLDKWVDRVCQCENMTLVRKSTLENMTYFAIFNDGKLGLIFNWQYTAYFGTRSSSSSDTSLSGLQATMSDFVCNPNSEGTNGSEYFFPYEVDCDLIIDSDNNLVRSSGLMGVGNYITPNYGFMFSNGGIFTPTQNSIYSMGNSPAVIKTFEAWNNPTGFIMNYNPKEGEEDTVYMSDTFVKNSTNKLEIRDHVKFIFSPKLARYQNSGMGEIIQVDDVKYVHIGMGYCWLPITEIVHENIEVTGP